MSMFRVEPNNLEKQIKEWFYIDMNYLRMTLLSQVPIDEGKCLSRINQFVTKVKNLKTQHSEQEELINQCVNDILQEFLKTSFYGTGSIYTNSTRYPGVFQSREALANYIATEIGCSPILAAEESIQEYSTAVIDAETSGFYPEKNNSQFSCSSVEISLTNLVASFQDNLCILTALSDLGSSDRVDGVLCTERLKNVIAEYNQILLYTDKEEIINSVKERLKQFFIESLQSNNTSKILKQLLEEQYRSIFQEYSPAAICDDSSIDPFSELIKDLWSYLSTEKPKFSVGRLFSLGFSEADKKEAAINLILKLENSSSIKYEILPKHEAALLDGSLGVIVNKFLNNNNIGINSLSDLNQFLLEKNNGLAVKKN